MSVCYFPDRLPKAVVRADSMGRQVQLCFFDFRGGVLLNQDSEDIVCLPDRPSEFYSQHIRFGACIPQPMPLAICPEKALGRSALDGQFYIDNDGGVNTCLWMKTQDGVLDKIIIRCVLDKETDEAYSVNLGPKKRFGKRLSPQV